MARDLPHASTLESLRFTLQAMLPNVAQGLFRRRPRAVAAATRMGVDGHAVRLLGGIRRAHGRVPVWVRAGSDRMLLVLETEHVRRVLEGSPDPFAPDPDAKRRGMSHFQPDALTISRGELWGDRRRFAEAVLDTGEPLHRLADSFLAVVREEAATLLARTEGARGGRLEWEPFNGAGQRIARRVILGDAARDDEALTTRLWELMEEANGLPKQPSERLEPLLAAIARYVEAAEEGSLVGLFDGAPSDPETRAERQVTHWLFALGDTLPANGLRALALIASHPGCAKRVDEELAAAVAEGPPGAAGISDLPYLEACLQEAMRLWPTTPVLSRETLTDTEWDGGTVPAGTQILISNTFNHRDPERHEFADRFAPEAWTEGGAGRDWSFNHFSHGPQGCPGAGLALFVGKALLAELLAARRLRLVEPKLDPERPLPHMLDFFRIRLAVEPRG